MFNPFSGLRSGFSVNMVSCLSSGGFEPTTTFCGKYSEGLFFFSYQAKTDDKSDPTIEGQRPKIQQKFMEYILNINDI